MKVDVEIWPTSMVFKKGHRIRLDVQPRDGVGSQSYMHYHADYNTGTNTIYAGGEYGSPICCCRSFRQRGVASMMRQRVRAERPHDTR